jgi:hypothetical protein
MATLREDIADLMSRVEESEHSARGLPHRSRYLLIVTSSCAACSSSTSS